MTTRIFTSRPSPIHNFSLDGEEVKYVRDPQTGEVKMEVVGRWEEAFAAVGTAPPEVIVTLLSVVKVDTAGRAAWQVPSLIAYIQSVLIDDDRPRFAQLMGDKHRLVEASVLGDCVEWLNEELFGRPLVRAGGSQPGPTPSQT